MTSSRNQTTAQSLGALLKSARDIMRRDKGPSGDLDRLPMLTWLMFFKFLDDFEIQREGEAQLAGKKFKPAIEPPYRWPNWAAKSDGITGDELLAFINNEETTVPLLAEGHHGGGLPKEGAGLFRHLRTLTSSNGDDRREVIATVFKGVDILATKLTGNLDPAFMRRFRFVVKSPAPDPDKRARVWHSALPGGGGGRRPGCRPIRRDHRPFGGEP